MKHEAQWTAQELRNALDRYEEELRAAGKARNTVNTYLQHPERFINWLVGRYRPTQSDGNPKPDSPSDEGTDSGRDEEGRRPGGSSRYDPLRRYLAERTDPVVHL